MSSPDREKRREAWRRWYAKHAEEYQAKRRAKRDPEKQQAAWKRYYEKNGAKVREKERLRYHRDPKKREAWRLWRLKDVAKADARAKQWKRENPEKVLTNQRQQRAKRSASLKALEARLAEIKTELF